MLNSINGRKMTKTALVPLQMFVEDFVEEVCSHFDMLREHHCIAKAQ